MGFNSAFKGVNIKYFLCNFIYVLYCYIIQYRWLYRKSSHGTGDGASVSSKCNLIRTELDDLIRGLNSELRKIRLNWGGGGTD